MKFKINIRTIILYLRFKISSIFFHFILWLRNRPKNIKNLPIIIISFNQYASLIRLIDYLERNDFRNIIIIDNCSSYPPLINYLNILKSRHVVYRMDENYGHRVFWKRKDLFSKYAKEYHVVTDPDILPCENCPGDFIQQMYKQLLKYPEVNKVGFSLKIDDIPEYNPNKSFIKKWEEKFWQIKNSEGHYIADIDTTFALYRPSNIKPIYKNFFKAIRLSHPYSARHLGWYIDPNNLTDEQLFYQNTASKSSSWLNKQNDSKINIYKSFD